MSSYAHTAEQVLLANPTTVGASVTAQAVSRPFHISAEDSKYLVLDVTVSAVTHTNSIVITLQDSQDGTNWVSKKAFADITTTGQKTIKLLVEDTNDQQYLPLRSQGRLVITTGVSDSVTFTSILKSARK